MVTISHKVKLQNWLKFATLPLATSGSHVSNWLKLGLPRHLGSSACHFFRSPEKNCLSSHFHFQPGGQEVWSISISRQKKMSVWSRCRAEVDKAGKDKAPLMLQTADRHLLVLSTLVLLVLLASLGTYHIPHKDVLTSNAGKISTVYL